MENTTRLIPLTQSQFAIVDEVDYEWLMQWKWYASRGRKTFYAMRKTASPNRKSLHMHTAVARRAGMDEAFQADHKDRNGLNNTRANLRPATARQQAMNRTKMVHCFSPLKGALWRKERNKWFSRIMVRGKSIGLGTYSTAQEAHEAYVAAAHKLFGEFACEG